MTQYNRSYLIENTASSNRSKARRYMRNNSEMTDDESMQLDQELRVRFDNANKCDCKFLLGLARMYMNGELDDNSTAQAVNQALGIATEEPYASQLNRDLNGMSAMQFIDAFKDKIEASGEADKENLSNQDFGGNNGYGIVLIDSFEKASEYAKYTTWCVTENEGAYEKYTKGGTFYFCLKKGFENVEKVKGDNAPLDEYGLSMIAVSIYPDGKCNTITCRWNHEQGDDDHVMTTEGLSKVIGENFYDVFKPIKRTFLFCGKEFIVGRTEDGFVALYDEDGNNILGDWVQYYSIDKEMSEAFGIDVLKIENDNQYISYITIKNNKPQEVLADVYSKVYYLDSLSKYTFYCPTFYVVNENGLVNYLLVKDGSQTLLFDEWFYDIKASDKYGNDEVDIFIVYNSDGLQKAAVYKDEEVKWLTKEWFKYFGVSGSFNGGTLFSLQNKNGLSNFLLYKDDVASYLFDEWFSSCSCNKALSKQFGVPCFSIIKDNRYWKYTILKNGKIEYLSNIWHRNESDARKELKEYLKQNNESRIQHLSNIITEMVITKLK